MTIWTGKEIAEALGLSPARATVAFTSVSTDSRTLEPGALFVALRGERFDGHRFLEAAADRGALGAVVQRGTRCPNGLVQFEVDDTLFGLGRLATARRATVEGPVVAITGTNGKTSTKEMLARALGTRWDVHATRANRNNLIGVPLTILEAPQSTEVLVVEAGASIPGEVARIRDIIRPTIGVVTNVSVGHVEGFGSMVGVMQEKVALLEGVGHAVVGSEPPELRQAALEVTPRVTVAGTSSRADVYPTALSIRVNGCAELEFREHRVRLPVVGAHQAENAMVALAVADVLGLELDDVIPALESVQLPSGRCRVVESDRLTLIDDTYNANPASLSAALETTAGMARGRPVVVGLGTMRELGEDGPALHQEMAGRVVEQAPTLIAVTGDFIGAFAPWADELGDRLIEAPDPDTLGQLLAARLEGGELVLLKASRSVHLERAIPHLIGDEDA